MKLRLCFVIVSLLLATVCATLAQNTATSSTPASTQVPRLIKFLGVAKDESSKPLTGVVGITFSLYQDQQGGATLWTETQNVQADAAGHYTALLGSATADGVPLALFSSAEVHWISTQVAGQHEQARAALLSVPYALKAADAETLGGLPASAFVHSNLSTPAGKGGSQAASTTTNALPPAGVTGKGTKNFVPLWTGATTQGNSVIYETGGNIGIGTKTPKAAVDVVGRVNGFEGAATGQVYGVSGATNSSTNQAAGVSGFEGAKTGAVFGVVGGTNSSTGGAAGVSGYEGATSGSVAGVVGTTTSTNGSGIAGFASATAGPADGVFGQSASPSGLGVAGFNTATTGPANGVYGQTASTNGAGVVGSATATSGAAIGVLGVTTSPNGGGGAFTNLAGGTSAVIVANGASYAQVFSVDASGNVNIKGKLTKGSGSFKIDHPLDPANKYLSHSFVESPDMMNVYNGNITTDHHGAATVTLPDYFEALNRDFRYQLTVIGQFAQAIVKQEIENNRFTIKTSKPSVKVSWQVTGIRHDAYADAYRIPTEEEKPPLEQGHYLHPELLGASPEQSIGYRLPSAYTTADRTQVAVAVSGTN
jgi:hypothetical protein